MRIYILAIALTWALMMTPTADACSCGVGLTFSLPDHGETNIPIDAHIQLGWTFETPPATYSLEAGDGTVEPLQPTFTTYGNVTLISLTRETDGFLTPHTPYAVVADDRVVLGFTTGYDLDGGAPELSGLSDVHGNYDDGCSKGACSSCGESTMIRFVTEGAYDGDTPEADLLFKVFMVPGTDTPTETSPAVVIPGGWGVGEALCSTTWPDMAVGDVYTLRVATVDVAGKLSPLTEPVTVEIEDDPDVLPGCQTGASSPASWAGLLGLGLLGLPLLRRRRR